MFLESARLNGVDILTRLLFLRIALVFDPFLRLSPRLKGSLRSDLHVEPFFEVSVMSNQRLFGSLSLYRHL
jgi:hypothetical protein